MKLAAYSSFVTDMHREGMIYAAQRAARLGFDAVETLGSIPNDREESIDRRYPPEELRRVLEACGLSCVCHSVAVRRLDLADAAMLDDIYRHIDFAARVGAPYLHHTLILPLTPPPQAPSYGEAIGAVLPWAEKIADRCLQYGMECLYEPQGLYFNGVSGLAPLAEEMWRRGQKIGICGDLGNSLFVDEAPAQVIAHFAKEIRHVHVKDYRICKASHEGTYPTRAGLHLASCEIGEGDVDLPACFAALRAVGYAGSYSFEINGEDAVLRRAIERVRALTE